MNAESEAEYEALIEGFRAGISKEGPVDTKAAARMLALMPDAGGEELVGSGTELLEGTFYQPDR